MTELVFILSGAAVIINSIYLGWLLRGLIEDHKKPRSKKSGYSK
jgi:hypothetical protein